MFLGLLNRNPNLNLNLKTGNPAFPASDFLPRIYPREILDKSEKFPRGRRSWQGDAPAESRPPGVWSRHTVTTVDSQ